ncbi:MAG: hypothetical protein KDD51_16045 [Bdellovibrionales bacterium]|nr:hypothetical protein [Bdellovibrionales bacterium]
MKHLAALSLFFATTLLAASLPTGMTQAEVDKTVEVLGTGGATRLLRSAEPYPFYPGIKVGFEALFFSSSSLIGMGNGDGSMPPVLFVPRLYLAKGLVADVDLILSFLPGGVVPSLSTVGAALKWTFLSERENIPGSIAAYFAYTSLRGLDRYLGTDLEFGLLASRDLVRVRPFLGLGVLFASGTVQNTVSGQLEGRHSTFHLFGGIEWELPANITLQLDLMNLNFQGSVFVGKKF